MHLRTIEGVDFSQARVLVRTDFNIERTNLTKVEEHFRIDITKPLIDKLFTFPGIKVAILTHFGRPNGVPNEEDSVRHLVKAVERGLGRPVVFLPALEGPEVSEALRTLPQNAILLLENVRFSPKEEANDPDFAKALAEPFTHYINEAFSVSHRAHASVVGLPKFLPSFAGLRVEKETHELESLLSHPARPAVALIGGAKIETKLPLIRSLQEKYDCILLGGKVANEAIDKKLSLGDNVLVPRDFNGEERFDIGPNTVAYYSQILKTAKTIVWNGPLGKFEEKPYNLGTDLILDAILETDTYFVIGGGESIAVVERANVMPKIDFVSSGGGAMLSYLGREPMPGLEALTV